MTEGGRRALSGCYKGHNRTQWLVEEFHADDQVEQGTGLVVLNPIGLVQCKMQMRSGESAFCFSPNLRRLDLLTFGQLGEPEARPPRSSAPPREEILSRVDVSIVEREGDGARCEETTTGSNSLARLRKLFGP